MSTPRIELLYFDGCPNWELADRLVREAIATRGLPASSIRYRKVESPEEAEELSFRGSPTIHIDGVDPFADESAPIGLSCRVYRRDGQSSGSPSLGELQDALDRKVSREEPG